MQNLLIEQVMFEYQVIKEQNKPRRMRGIFQRANVKNANGRVYKDSILKREVERLLPSVKNRTLVGQLDHPTTATIEYSKASHLIPNLSYDESNGTVIGEVEILNTPSGKIVESLIDAGVKVGISSRGLGTVEQTSDEKTGDSVLVVNDDYQWVTQDIVAEPSTPGSYLQLSEGLLKKIYTKEISKNINKPEHLKNAIYTIVDEFLKEYYK